MQIQVGYEKIEICEQIHSTAPKVIFLGQILVKLVKLAKDGFC
jgi:hypothetical protein